MGKCWLHGQVYIIDSRRLDADLLKLLNECKQFTSARLSSEMRMSESEDVSRNCEEVTLFATEILESQIDDCLKTALFNYLNMMGYMVDRSAANWRMCFQSLNYFIDVIENFKGGLPSLDLLIWNQSTYGGEKQVPLFRSYLEAAMSPD
jgi:hypothetical protein